MEMVYSEKDDRGREEEDQILTATRTLSVRRSAVSASIQTPEV